MIRREDDLWLNLAIDELLLDGFSGSYRYRANELAGEIHANGVALAVPTTDWDAPLDPDFDQERFEASFACKEDLYATIPRERIPDLP